MLYLHELMLSEPRPNRALLGMLNLYELMLSKPRPNRASLGMQYLFHAFILSLINKYQLNQHSKVGRRMVCVPSAHRRQFGEWLPLGRQPGGRCKNN